METPNPKQQLNLVQQSVEQYRDQLSTAPRLVIGFSGGLDSSVLLHLIATQFANKTTALHINHGLSSNAAVWQQHCATVCAALNVEFVTRQVVVENAGNGVEDAARQARYQAFTEILTPNSLLLLAHQSSDQAETVLYRLLRGAGVKGLMGIQATRQLGLGKILRPLLELSRSQLLHYAEAQGLRWIHDESNDNNIYDRNYLRNEVMQKIQQRWPQSEAAIRRAASHCFEAQQLNDQLALLDLAQLDQQTQFDQPWLSDVYATLELDGLLNLPLLRRKNLLRYWVSQFDLTLPSTKQLENLLVVLSHLDAENHPCVSFGENEFRVYQQRLYLLKRQQPIEPIAIAAALDSAMSLPGNGCIKFYSAHGDGLKLSSEQALEIRYRAGSERCRPVGRAHSQSLKKLLQEYKIEPWVRDKIPLLFVDGCLAAVIGLWYCAEFAVQQKSTQEQATQQKIAQRETDSQAVEQQAMGVEVVWKK